MTFSKEERATTERLTGALYALTVAIESLAEQLKESNRIRLEANRLLGGPAVATPRLKRVKKSAA
jgi:hypothetical protein